MQSNFIIIIALILCVVGILLGVALILDAPFTQGPLAASIGLALSLIGIALALRGNRAAKTAIGTFTFILAVIGIIINIILLIQWAACAAFTFITVDASVGTGVFGELFQI